MLTTISPLPVTAMTFKNSSFVALRNAFENHVSGGLLSYGRSDRLLAIAAESTSAGACFIAELVNCAHSPVVLKPPPAATLKDHHIRQFQLWKIMPNLGQRYIAALCELSQFHLVVGDKTTLVHILSGVQVAPESHDEEAENADLLRLTFGGGHTTFVAASYYLELMLSEDAAHRLHSASEGSGEVHKRAKQLLEHLSRKHNLLD